jgi:hypothetical protein
LLERQASSKLFDGEGDHERDGTFYYAAGLECLFPQIAEAAVQDGVSARTVMKMLVGTAFEILSDPCAKPGEGREIGALVVQEAQRVYSVFYPSDAEIEELKRDAAAWRAAHPRKTTQQDRTESRVKSTTTH